MNEVSPSEIVVNNGRVYHLGLAAGQLAPHLFLVGDPARALKVAERFESVEHEVRNREYVTLTGSYRGTPMSVIGTGIGADNVEIALVEAHVIHAFDLDSARRRPDTKPLTIIRIGTSGGARADIPAGTLGITTYAIGLDSTGLFNECVAADQVVTQLEEQAFDALDEAIAPSSRFKGRIHPYASKAAPEVVAALERQAADAGVTLVTGVTVTAPGFYGASGRFIDGLVNTVRQIKTQLAAVEVGAHRVINFEMESSLLFHLAASLGYRAATLCPIISSPGSHAVVIDYDPHIEQSITIALDAMLRLAQE